MPLTNGSVSGSKRPKNIQIRRIRIRNTVRNCPKLCIPDLVSGSEELAGAVLQAQVLAVHHQQGLDARQHQVLRHLENIHKNINPESSVSDPDQDTESGSGSGRAKITQENRKIKKFLFLKCWIMDVLF